MQGSMRAAKTRHDTEAMDTCDYVCGGGGGTHHGAKHADLGGLIGGVQGDVGVAPVSPHAVPEEGAQGARRGEG
jgi:hypothetical protein